MSAHVDVLASEIVQALGGCNCGSVCSHCAMAHRIIVSKLSAYNVQTMSWEYLQRVNAAIMQRLETDRISIIALKHTRNLPAPINYE